MSDGVPELRMYGYCVAWRRRSALESRDPAELPPWKIEQCEDHLNLPGR